MGGNTIKGKREWWSSLNEAQPRNIDDAILVKNIKSNDLLLFLLNQKFFGIRNRKLLVNIDPVLRNDVSCFQQSLLI
tara:strand:+ start:651 stop:881 length:231 start_codon:yes stop_codon:yes gene_type:complete